MTSTRLEVTREQVLAYRRRVGALDERLPRGRRSLRRAAWAGLKDSMPRAALLSIHARVEGTQPSTWEDPAFVQLWGPCYHAYVVAAVDRPVFTLGRLPDDERSRRTAEEVAARVGAILGGARMGDAEVARALGDHPNKMRYAAPTGTLLIRWDGARAPTLWAVPPPDVDPHTARLELARRYLHILGPTTAEGFSRWAGISERGALAAFEALRRSLTPVRTSAGDAWILTSDEPALRAAPGPTAPAHFLPSGDAYLLAEDRALLVPDPDRRDELWPSRVWPGGLLVHGEIVGSWRRAERLITIHAWRRLSPTERHAVEAEATGLPLPRVSGRIAVQWDG